MKKEKRTIVDPWRFFDRQHPLLWLLRQPERQPEPVSRDEILRSVLGQGKTCFPVQLTTSRIVNYARLVYTQLKVLSIYIKQYH